MAKLAIIFVVIFASSINALDKEFIEKFMEELQEVGGRCVVETNASNEDISDLLAHKIPESHSGQCMIFCFHKHFHIQNEDGSLDPTGALKSLEPLRDADLELHGKVTKIMATCGMTAVIDPDPCVTAAGLARCAEAEGRKMGLTPEMFEI